ncbi:BRO family protein [uncultured Duodenibacillus sp.]|uniref:BRO family protein n=1 Tax=uncultured Duodenibacillus sp. TaxID=1980699 RepID=UPI00258CB011|nr:BRO family protein [uncultured Duodenibacillus sp.]
MSLIQNIAFGDLSIRAFDNAGTPWFVATDICRGLGIKNTSDALCVLRDVERQKLTIDGRETNIVRESGVYTLALRCQEALKEGTSAYNFRIWLTDEVLPAIRKTGRYEAQETITPAEQLQIQQAVARRAKTSSANYQTIYRAIKVRFQIPRYTELPRCQFAECLKFIDAVDLKVPEAKTAAAPKQEPRALPKSGKPNLTPLNIPEGRKMYRVSEDFLEKQRTFVYCWRYLFRDDLELFYNFLKQTESPLAPKFAEAIMDFNLWFVEDSLAKLGFAVKDLDCYKHWEAKRLAV